MPEEDTAFDGAATVPPVAAPHIADDPAPIPLPETSTQSTGDNQSEKTDEAIAPIPTPRTTNGVDFPTDDATPTVVLGESEIAADPAEPSADNLAIETASVETHTTDITALNPHSQVTVTAEANDSAPPDTRESENPDSVVIHEPTLQLTTPNFDLVAGGVAPSEFVPPTWNPQIDGLIQGRKWSQPSISYSFPDSIDDYSGDYDRYSIHAEGFTAASPQLQSVVRDWLGQISSVVPLSFLQVESAAIAKDDQPPGGIPDFPTDDAPTEIPIADGPTDDVPTGILVADGPTDDAPTEIPIADGPTDDVPTEIPIADGPTDDAPTEIPIADGPTDDVPTAILAAANAPVDNTAPDILTIVSPNPTDITPPTISTTLSLSPSVGLQGEPMGPGSETTPRNQSTPQEGNATIRVALSDDPNPAYAYSPFPSDEAGDVWFNQNPYGDLFHQAQLGDYGWHNIGHELGHTLGLKHGHERGGVAGVALPAAWDSMEFTLMTYRTYVGQTVGGPYTNAYGHYAQSLMMLDIQALQSLYGANYTANAGDTVYQFSPTTGEMWVNGQGQGAPVVNTIFRTLWDGNGVDTYDLSNYDTPLQVDLTPGGFVDLDVGGTHQRANLNGLYGTTAIASDDPHNDADSKVAAGNVAPHGDAFIYARGHVFNALLFEDDPRSLIENAIGGAGNDQIIGNRADNRLEGNQGNDNIQGGAGNDVLLDGAGNDRLMGGTGADVFVLAADGQLDTIVDFAVGEGDRLDLSAWQIEDLSQVSLSAIPLNGRPSTQLQYQQEALYLEGIDPTSVTVNALLGLPQDALEPMAEPEDHGNVQQSFPTPFNLPTPVELTEIPGTEEGDRLVGTAASERLRGGNGNDWLDGHGPASQPDELLGDSGADSLVGDISDELEPVNEGQPNEGQPTVLSQIDVYVGRAGQDTFVLGNSDRPHYATAGRDDYVWISDYDADSDLVILHGSASQYQTAIANQHTELWLKPAGNRPGELVAYFGNTVDFTLQGDGVQYV